MGDEDPVWPYTYDPDVVVRLPIYVPIFTIRSPGKKLNEESDGRHGKHSHNLSLATAPQIEISLFCIPLPSFAAKMAGP